MGVWDRASELPRKGRWHCRLHDPTTGVVFFYEVISQTEITSQDAMDQAELANPTLTVEWAVWEPSRSGVFANGFGRGAPNARTGREE